MFLGEGAPTLILAFRHAVEKGEACLKPTGAV